MLALLLATLANAACPADALAISQAAAARMELAFHSVDDELFDTSRFALEAAVPCIQAELTVADVAAIHRSYALGAFADGEDERARLRLAAVRAVQPAWVPPDALMPVNHPLRTLFDNAQVVTGRAPLPEHSGAVYVDGLRATEAPDGRAFLIQAFAPDGSVLITRYCDDGSCLAEIQPVLLEKDASRKQIVQRRWRLGGTTAGALLLAGGVAGLVVAADARSELDSGPAPSEIDALYGRSRTGFGLGVGGVAAGAIVAGAVWVVPF